MPSRRLAITAGISLLALMPSCNNGNRESTRDRKSERPSVARYDQPGPGGDSALLVGSVRRDTGCLLVEESDSGTVYIPVFAQDDGRPEALSEGEEVSLGGGVSEPSGEIELPDACAGTDYEYWLVNPET